MYVIENNKIENISRLFSPQSIVFIGNKGIVSQAIRNNHLIGFSGDIFVVHPTESQIEGYTCYPSIQDLPNVPDVAFVSVRGEKTIEIVQQLNTLGTAGCVCYAAGFAEIGAHDLQEKLVDAAGNMALIGPNCYGMINYLDRVILWPDRFGGKPAEKGIAVISQSGNISLNFTLSDRSVPLAYVISVGNQAVLKMEDYVDALLEDSRITAIGLHIEGLDDIEKFSKVAKKALKKQIPIVALKTGTSSIGSELTLSHTSSLAGSDELYQTLFTRLNICRTDSMSTFLETLKLFSVTGKINGRNLGVLTCSGGDSTLAADLADKKKFVLPKLSHEQIHALRQQMPEFAHVSNPLDYNTSIWGNEQELERCFSTMVEGNFDVTILILDYLQPTLGDLQGWKASITSLINTKRNYDKPIILLSVLSEGIPGEVREILIENKITPLQGLSDSFAALDNVINYYQSLQQIGNIEEIHERLLQAKFNHPIRNDKIVDEWESKQILSQFGLLLPKGQLLSSADELEITKEVTGPFVVKAVSSEIPHKTEAGAVILNLQDKESVINAIEEINARTRHVSSANKKFLVEEMVSETVAELVIGLKRDEQFGLALVIGTGGIFVNFLNDSSTLLLPTNENEIRNALSSLKGFQLLNGFRGRPKGDINYVIEIIKGIARFAEEYADRILELDVNPLLVLPEGKGAVACDALIRFSVSE
ncbi:acetate--CoA ligase family protein [Anaerobacillus sp. MEB173]|uniref:acetate--CoA ligase family protein n=1 Tax=Anaerobacillus sp. MEB173 TaxID=3383345 RepID=UPI003F93AFC2